MTKMANQLDKMIQSKDAVIGVIGLGYVGIPLINTFLHSGFKVIGFDIDKKKISSLKSGKSYLKHINIDKIHSSYIKEIFLPTSDFAKLAETDVILICVPTPLDDHRNPDLSYVLKTTEVIAANMKPGQLIVLESTTYPGTTEEELLPILSANKMEVGKHFFLAFSPEREDPGNPNFTTSTIPKVVGGVTGDCLHLAKSLYDTIIEKTVPVSSARVAEATKLFENIFRSVNIAMVNELKMIFDRMNIDVWEVIDAASSKPFGFMPFYPGPGFGGHCIPVDPFYLTWKAKEYDYSTKFIELAGEINTNMPYYVVQKTMDALNARDKSIKGARILILGMAYKKDVDDQRESPAVKILEILKDKDASVDYNDPHVPEISGYRKHPDLHLKSIELNEETIKNYDAVIIATDHSAYDYDWIAKKAKLIIDTRNAIKSTGKNIIRA